jgi:hypothetical protein
MHFPVAQYIIISDASLSFFVFMCIAEGKHSEGVEMRLMTTSWVLAWSTAVMVSAADIDLSQFHITFSDEFEELSVSARGPLGPEGTVWMADRPCCGDFGSARFVDPEGDFPFTVSDGILRIEASRESGRWESGILSSADREYRGFTQQYGYFEARMKMPPGPGTWPAFWLHAVDISDHFVEIDIVEHYGYAPERVFTFFHLHNPHDMATGRHYTACESLADNRSCLTEEFHTYGCLFEEDSTFWYLDRERIYALPTPEDARAPVYILLNLALGGGWPIDNTPEPSYLYVDYVRAWARGPEDPITIIPPDKEILFSIVGHGIVYSGDITSVEVYNARGILTNRLDVIDNKIIWNGLDKNGNTVAGLHILKINGTKKSRTLKVMAGM